MFGQDIVAYLPEAIKPFGEQLKQFPKGYEKWVYSPSLPTEVYQGDVLSQVLLASVDENGELFGAQIPGMVISNTCDAQPDRGEYVLMAPVIDFEHYRENTELKGEELDNHLRDLAANKISTLMFLPKAQGFNPSFVDFGNISPMSLSHFYSGPSKKRVLSLSQCGHYFMLMKIAYHFSRPEASDAKRS